MLTKFDHKDPSSLGNQSADVSLASVEPGVVGVELDNAQSRAVDARVGRRRPDAVTLEHDATFDLSEGRLVLEPPELHVIWTFKLAFHLRVLTSDLRVVRQRPHQSHHT